MNFFQRIIKRESVKHENALIEQQLSTARNDMAAAANRLKETIDEVLNANEKLRLSQHTKGQ